MYDLTRDLPTPSLDTLLGRGCLVRHDNGANRWLSKAFGLRIEPPFAPLRRMGLTGETSSQRFLCVDPVNFSFVDRNVTVSEPDKLQLTTIEANALGEALGPVFQVFGELEITAPASWHLKMHDTAPALPALMPLPDFIGRRADQGLPADPQWRHLINEAQILLHNHPVNHAREERGLPRINSIWPWGGGNLVTGTKTVHDAVFGQSPVLHGLSRLCGLNVLTPPGVWEPLPHRSPLVVLDQLAPWRNRGNGLSWRDAVAAIETNWFAPLLSALRRGTLGNLTLILPGSDRDSGARLEVSRSSILKIWRRPAPLTLLAA
ncbi:MAG: hypothetical protein KBA96_08355 [Rhodocyclaceae bacterium]|nr:hypothetical protein [Rhodocyclaceae bacterium]